MNGLAAESRLAGPGGQRIRSGAIPSLVSSFVARPESAPGLADVLVPGAVVALTSADDEVPRQRPWSCGKTQLAVYHAEWLWQTGRLMLLAWVDARNRASVVSGYVEAAVAAGLDRASAADPASDNGTIDTADELAARFVRWLADLTLPWLVVLDDVRDAAELAGLWPCGRTGAVLITAAAEAAIAGQLAAHIVRVGALSSREALNYLMSRLVADPEQRQGALELAMTLGGDPCALAQASALISTASLSCRDYLRQYAQARDRMPARHGEVANPVAITWRLSAQRAEQLAAGGSTRLILAIVALLDGHPVPADVFATRAVQMYLTEGGSPAANPERAWKAVQALESTGLLTIDPVTEPPLARMSRALTALVRANTPLATMEQAARAAADALLEIWPEQEPTALLVALLRSSADAVQRTTADHLRVDHRHEVRPRTVQAPAARDRGHGHEGRVESAVDTRLGGTGLVADDLWLIAHDDVTGKPLLKPRSLGIGVAGALIAELMMAGCITLGRERAVVPRRSQNGEALASDLLSQPLAGRLMKQIGAEQTRPLREWLLFVGRNAEQDVAVRLESAGYVIRAGKRPPWQLGRWEPIDPDWAYSALVRAHLAVDATRPLTAHNAVLAGLAAACGLGFRMDQHVPTAGRGIEDAVLLLDPGLRELIAEVQVTVDGALLSHRK